MQDNGNRISNGRSPNNIPFINQNIDVLNKLSQMNGFLYFNGQRIGNSLSVTQYNDQSKNSQSDSSYNISFDGVRNIVFQGAVVKQNPYKPQQVIVVIDKIGDYIQQQNLLVTKNDFYKIKQVNSELYNASTGQYLICNGQSSTTIILPSDIEDMDYIKIATLDKINTENIVTISVKNLGIYINSTNQTTLVIDSPYSSVQLIFSKATNTWKVITPFVPIDRNTSGLTQEEAMKTAKKQMLVFG